MKKILVIDDDEDITTILKLGLKRYDFEVDSYNDPQKAIVDFKRGKYRLVILDVRLRETNGFDLYRTLKKIDSDMKVCFFTAYAMYEDTFHALFPELKPDCFLRKPMPIPELAGKIRRLIE
jgi:two-component system, OmpR family, response regulator ChvI